MRRQTDHRNLPSREGLHDGLGKRRFTRLVRTGERQRQGGHRLAELSGIHRLFQQKPLHLARQGGEFLGDQPLVLELIRAQAQAPLKDAAAVNATRWELFRRLEALGLPLFPTAPILSPTVTAARVPPGLDGATIVRHMHARYRTVIAGQRTKLSGRIIRFGTMGWVDDSDILTYLHHLECTLRDLGQTPPTGAGVTAAARVLAT